MSTRYERRRGFIWNSLGGVFVAFQPAILMYFAAKNLSQEMSGIISVSYAIGVLLYSIARYGMRNYQVTDVNIRYSFETYFRSRFITIITSLFFVVLYLILQLLFGDYSITKATIILEIVILRLIAAFEDVFTGSLQQQGHFDLGAKILAIREGVVLFSTVLFMYLKFNPKLIFLLSIVLSITVELALLKRFWIYFPIKELNTNNNNIVDLLKDCFPLAVCTTLSIFVGNLPKYETDWYLNDYSQAILGYLILPCFSAIMFNQFVYTPLIKDLADIYYQDKKKYKQSIHKQLIIILLITVFMTIIAIHPGLWILSIIYGVNLTHYSLLISVLMMSGGVYTIHYYLSIPLTIMNKQRALLFAYFFSILFTALLQSFFVSRWKLMGVAIIYLISNLIIAIFLIIALTNKKTGC